MADVSSLTDYYKNLLIVQYNNQPKAQATIGMYADEILANGIAFDVRDAYDIDSAVGVQLDVIGAYVGVDRYSTAVDVDEYFGFTRYADFSLVSGNYLIDEFGHYIVDEFGNKIIINSDAMPDPALLYQMEDGTFMQTESEVYYELE
jgi:Protein of unknown function (DUF2612)